VRNLSGGGDLLASLMAGHIADGLDAGEALDAASRTAREVIAESPGERDLALLDNLELVRKSG